MIHGDTRNLAMMCQDCNSFRASCLHCWALVACVRDVARREGVRPAVIFRRWGLNYLRQPEHDPAVRKRNSAVAASVDQIGLDEFAFPADTAAARVWNLATLARHYRGPAPGV